MQIQADDNETFSTIFRETTHWRKSKASTRICVEHCCFLDIPLFDLSAKISVVKNICIMEVINMSFAFNSCLSISQSGQKAFKAEVAGQDSFCVYDHTNWKLHFKMPINVHYSHVSECKGKALKNPSSTKAVPVLVQSQSLVSNRFFVFRHQSTSSEPAKAVRK